MLTLIKGAEIYSPAFIGKKDVLICGETIHMITDNLNPCTEYGIKIIDGSGKYMFPGFIDSHVHILGGGGEGSYHTRTPEIMLTDIVLGGVTTIVGCLGTDGTTRTMASLLAKARGLEEEGITAYVYTGSYQVPVRTLTGSVMDDLILIDKIIGTGEIAISDHRSSQPTKEEFAKIAADTRVGGILSGKAGIVNIHMGDGKKKLSMLRWLLEETEIPPANLIPTHINRSNALMQDGIDYAKTLGGIIDLTTSSDPDFLDEDEVKASTGLKMALDAGVSQHQITFSSDGQGSLPVFDKGGKFIGLGVGKVSSLYREFRDAVITDGISISQALMPVTQNPSAVLKLKRKGLIAPEMDADIILSDKKTLAIDTVLARGHVMVEGGLPAVYGTFENR